MRNGVTDQLFAGISCNLDSDLLQTAFPLFSQGKIEAIEWSFDALFRHQSIPEWFENLLSFFAENERLIGHGVYYSIFSGRFSEDQRKWLMGLDEISSKYNFDHITEHFGYMTGEDFHKGAPMNIPFTEESFLIAQDRMLRMHDACSVPVGLENLAFAFDHDSMLAQGKFLERIVKSVNGFIILDLHNVYCQVQNFDVDFETILDTMPLHRVREIHISGGTWEDSISEPHKKIRRDTHDDAVPDEVFEYLEKVIPLLPNLKYVILEQMGIALKTQEQRRRFQNDYLQMKQIMDDQKAYKPSPTNDFIPKTFKTNGQPYESEILHKQQATLSNILETSRSVTEVKSRLSTSTISNSSWQVERWSDAMLETAFLISQKWKNGF